MTRIYCPIEAELIRFVDADLSPEGAEHIIEHLSRCPTCSQQVRELRSLVEELGAPIGINLDVGAHVHDVLRSLDRTVAQPNRRPVIARLAAITVMAASVALAVRLVGLRYGSPAGTWQPRGSLQSESLSRDVGVQVFTLRKSPQPLRPGDTIAPDAALTAGFRNLGHEKAYMLLFAVDSHNAVHWITPKYTRVDEDPKGTELARTEAEHLLPTSVVFDGMASGPLRIVTIISPSPVRVSQVESLSQAELSQGSLARRFANAEVREIVVQVSNAYRGKAP